MNVATVLSTPPTAVDHIDSHSASTNPDASSSPTRTRDVSLLLPSMSKQRDVVLERSLPLVKKPWATVDPKTASTGSEKLQQLKESLREQRRRHATIGDNNQRTTSSSRHCHPPKCITTTCHTGNSGHGSSAVSVDGTTNSNSQCSTTSSNNQYSTSSAATRYAPLLLHIPFRWFFFLTFTCFHLL